MGCTRNYARTFRRVGNSGREGGRGREQKEGRKVVAADTGRGWNRMEEGWGYTEDRKQGQERIQAAATPDQ